MEEISTFGTWKSGSRLLRRYNSARIPLGPHTSMPSNKTRPFLNGGSSYAKPYGSTGPNSRPTHPPKLARGGRFVAMALKRAVP